MTKDKNLQFTDSDERELNNTTSEKAMLVSGT
jgi:hypothetical protein